MLGLVAGIDNLGAGIAFAALLFPSSLAVGLSMGVGSMLLSGTVIALVIALLSSHKNSVGMVQETAIAILAASSAGALAGMTDASDDAKVATVFAILGISTVATGALFWCAGRFRLGGLVRFLPYPVVAGFLAGSGWLLVEGAVTMLTGEHSVVHGIAKIGDPLIQAKIIPAFVFGVAMMAALHRWSHPMIPTSLLLWAGVTFYAILALAGIPAEQARNYGWLPEIPGDGSVALPMPNWILSNANWNAVLIALPAIASVAFLNIVGVLLNISGLEVAAGKEIDVNVELRSSGWANLASGIAGGASGYVGLGMTLLAGRMQANGRGAGIATALVLGGGLLVATDLASLMPSFLAAGLMLFLGLELLAEWAYASRRQLPVEEWLIVVAILVAIMATGFMTGLAVGLGISVVMFVYNYSRLPVVRLVASGSELRSSVDRSHVDSSILSKRGEVIHVVLLQGYLFFGTVERVVAQVRDRLRRTQVSPLRFVVLDLRNVSGVDSAATSGFVKISQMAALEDVTVIMSHMPETVRQLLALSGLEFDNQTAVRSAPDLDQALEMCEEQLLREESGYTGNIELVGQLQEILGAHPRLPDMASAMKTLTMGPGQTLIHAGEFADDVFVLGRGRVSVQIAQTDGNILRLRTMTSGAVVGEIALYRGGKRTADVTVIEPSTIFQLSRKVLIDLEKNDSELALLFHRLFAITLAEKLTVANKLIELSRR